MDVLIWIVILGWSILLGICVVEYLVREPARIGFFLALCGFLTIGLALFIITRQNGLERLLAVGITLAGVLAGYSAATMIFLMKKEKRRLPAIRTLAPEQRDHTAVIYFTHGEPPEYSPMPWLETFRELDADQVKFIPKMIRPFLFFKFRSAYLKVGASPHNEIHHDMMHSLRESYRAEGDESTRFYMGFLDSNPRPDEAIILALNEGANKILFATVFVTISSHTKAGQDMVKALGLGEYGVPICFSEPLWSSETLLEMFVARANANLNGTDKSKIGFLLVGHGQPEDWDRIYPTQTEQEIRFRQSIINRLVADGYTKENLAMGWMEFKKPKIGEVVQELANKGIEKLFVFAASISASSLHSLHDIPKAVEKSGLPDDLVMINLGAWDDDPIVIQAIKERLDHCLFINS